MKPPAAEAEGATERASCVTAQPTAGTGPLRQLLMETSQAEGLSMKDLTVLAVGNDPFRIDTPAGHRDGEWLEPLLDSLDDFADQTRRLIESRSYLGDDAA